MEEWFVDRHLFFFGGGWEVVGKLGGGCWRVVSCVCGVWLLRVSVVGAFYTVMFVCDSQGWGFWFLF